MKSLVVFFALAAVACGSLIAQPPHHPAIVLDPHGRPLDTAEVIGARAIHLQAKALEHHAPLVHAAPIAHAVAPIAVAPVAHSVLAAPAAVSHQSRVDVRTSHAPVWGAHAAPVLGAHAALAAPLLGHSALGLAGHGHWLKKRSLGHLALSPLAHSVIAAPAAAVSHQARVDVISSPAVVSHAVAAPVLAHAAPVIAPAAVSHQSRVDVRTSPAVIAHAAVAPIAHGGWAAAPVAHGAWAAAPVAHGAWAAAPVAHAGLLHSVHGGHWAHGY